MECQLKYIHKITKAIIIKARIQTYIRFWLYVFMLDLFMLFFQQTELSVLFDVV